MNNRTVELSEYLPSFLKQYREFQEIVNAEEDDFQTLSDESIRILDEIFMGTATDEGLIRFESILGIIPRVNDTTEDRQRRIKAWNINLREYTVEYLRDWIKTLQGNDDVSIYIDENNPFLLHVIIGYEDERYLEEVTSYVKKIIPANMETDIHSAIDDDNDVYGVELLFAQFTSEYNTGTRLAGATDFEPGLDFDSVSPIGGRYRCIVTRDGVELAAYGESAYNETGYLTQAVTVNGVTYPIGTQVQVMVKQPKFYYRVVPMNLKYTDDKTRYYSEKTRFYISAIEKDGFKIHPLFLDGDIELDYVYLAAFEGTYYDDSASTYETENPSSDYDLTVDWLASVSGALPFTGINRVKSRILAENVGDRWHLMFAESYSASALLFLIEYGSLNAAAKIHSGNINTGILCRTGKTSSLGNSSGYVTNDDGTISVTYRGEEGLWDNTMSFVDGINMKWDPDREVLSMYICTDLNFDEIKSTDNYELVPFNFSDTLSGVLYALSYAEKYDWLFMAYKFSNQSFANNATHVNFTYRHFDNSYFVQGTYYNYGSIGRKGIVSVYQSLSTQFLSYTSGRLVYLPES